MKIGPKDFDRKKHFSRYKFLVDHHHSGNILDIGNVGGIYGEGQSNSFHLKFAKEVSSKSKIYGFDLFKPQKPKLFPNQKQGDLEKGLPYQDNFFDTIYMGQVLEHVNNPGIVLGEIKRTLKKDGVFILDVPNPYRVLAIGRYLIKKQEFLGDPTHLIFYTPASLRAILEKNGFKLHKLAEKFPGHYRYVPYPLVKGLGSHLLVAAKPT
jgi:SAM-dependent methyltransferase